jgi:DNA-binding transcriptional regulator GbsR (MarR family)
MRSTVEQTKMRLIDACGKMSQDIGLGRIIGQVMAAIYLREQPSSLDDVEKELRLSKAAISIATRQLDKLGAINQVWIKGDRKTYYHTSNHLAATLQKGIIDLLKKKLQGTKEILKDADHLLKGENSKDAVFLKGQIGRARKIHRKIDIIINNPLMRLLGI